MHGWIFLNILLMGFVSAWTTKFAIVCDDNGMKNLNAYTILENTVSELNSLYDREDAKHLMDSDFVTGHLDDLDEIISQLRELTEFDPTP